MATELITVQEAAERLGVHHNAIRKLVREKLITAYRLGHRTLRVNMEEIVEVMKQ